MNSEIAADDAFPARRRRRELGAPWDVLGAVAIGGALGSVLRYGASLMWPGPGATLFVNVTGCLAIGVLMYLITGVVTAHRLARPFIGVGVLGGFTTFSTYVTDAVQLVFAGRSGMALTYLVVTVFAALGAVLLGLLLARLSVVVFSRFTR